MTPATSPAPASAAPATSNPGLGRYLAHLFSGAVLMFIFAFFMAVHLYYASSALLDQVVLLILFFLMAFVGLSVSSLVMVTMTGPGELPSRFSAARMDTFIQEELQHVVARAQPAGVAVHTTASLSSPASSGYAKSGALTTGGSGGTNGAGAAVRGTNWYDVDEADSHQLANVVAAAAMAERSSAAAEEAVLERAAAEARLRGYHHNIDDTTSASEHSDGDRDGGADAGEDDAPPQAELPPYMTEAMHLRRLRKLRRGLPVMTVSAVAQRVLTAMDGADMGRKQEEMRFLLPGANWCRFCRFYQMNDTRHCDVCGRCVYRSNMHSSCCGTCIGYANSKYYVLFLWYLCLSLVMADVLDLYCVSWGYTFFFKASGDANSVYYLVFVYSACFAIAGFGFVVQYLYAVGRGIGILTDLQQEQRASLAEQRASNNGAVYELIIMDSDAAVHPSGSTGDAGPVSAHDPAARTASPLTDESPFSWRRMADAIGEGLPVPLWFWPTPTRMAIKETADPPGYWEALCDAIRMRLRSVADVDDVFGDDDVADPLHDGAPHATTAAVSSSGGAADAAPAPAATVPKGTAPAAVAKDTSAAAAPQPPRAKRDEAAAVAVPSAPVGDARPPVAAVQPPQDPLLPVAAVSPSPPPAAKVAPAPKRKAD